MGLHSFGTASHYLLKAIGEVHSLCLIYEHDLKPDGMSDRIVMRKGWRMHDEQQQKNTGLVLKLLTLTSVHYLGLAGQFAQL